MCYFKPIGTGRAGLVRPLLDQSEKDTSLHGWLPAEAMHLPLVAFRKFVDEIGDGFTLWFRGRRVFFELPLKDPTRESIAKSTSRVRESIRSNFGLVTEVL